MNNLVDKFQQNQQEIESIMKDMKTQLSNKNDHGNNKYLIDQSLEHIHENEGQRLGCLTCTLMKKRQIER